MSVRSPPTPYMTCKGCFSPLFAPDASAMNEKKSSASRSRPRVYRPHSAKVESRTQE
ncbi:Uncharacterised protein [Mycobacteroides abscessus subsp. abscessus]|nr:Uncharacterised protein [Mycobacteroides abscessus subsp. abscessus]